MLTNEQKRDITLEVRRRLEELEDFIDSIEGVDYLIEVQMKDAENGFHIDTLESSSNWNTSWC